MEREIKISPGDNLESVVYTLLAAKARGEHVYCIFNGHKLHSDNVTMDSAYTEVLGYSKEEYDQKVKKALYDYEEREKSLEERERGYAEKVQASRTGDRKLITFDEIINGLKFIAEHQSLSQEELIDGLLELGCNFSKEDILRQFPEDILLFDGMRQGFLGIGADVILNVRDTEYGRAYCKDRFLSLDDDTSIYHFIRITTGDETYTKEMVDSLNNSNSKLM